MAFDSTYRLPWLMKLIPGIAGMIRKTQQMDAETLKALVEAQRA